MPGPTAGPGGNGLRILYKAETDGPSGRRRFRVAAAIRLPSQARFEVFGPFGGARLVIALDGERALLLSPADRRYDAAPASPEVMERLTGIPLPPRALLALLRGRSPCEAEPADRAAADPGAQAGPSPPHCEVEGVDCEGRREGPLLLGESLVRNGVPAAVVEWVPGDEGPAAWPRAVTVRLPKEGAVLILTRQDGPVEGPLPDELFAAAGPDGFTRAGLLDRRSLLLPALAGGNPAAEP